MSTIKFSPCFVPIGLERPLNSQLNSSPWSACTVFLPYTAPTFAQFSTAFLAIFLPDTASSWPLAPPNTSLTMGSHQNPHKILHSLFMRAGRRGHLLATLLANDNHKPPPPTTEYRHLLLFAPPPSVIQPQISPMVTQRGGIKSLLDWCESLSEEGKNELE